MPHKYIADENATIKCAKFKKQKTPKTALPHKLPDHQMHNSIAQNSPIHLKIDNPKTTARNSECNRHPFCNEKTHEKDSKASTAGAISGRTTGRRSTTTAATIFSLETASGLLVESDRLASGTRAPFTTLSTSLLDDEAPSARSRAQDRCIVTQSTHKPTNHNEPSRKNSATGRIAER